MDRASLLRTWHSFSRNKLAVGGLAFTSLLLAVALLAPVIVGDPNDMHFGASNVVLQPPSTEYLLGTDHLGRDVYSRVIWGTRVPLMVGLSAAFLSVGVGVVIGSISGYFGGTVDLLIMRLVDAVLMTPRFFLILLIVALLGSSIKNVILVIGVTTWPATSRLIRAEVIAQKQLDYVRAARLSGAGDWWILFSEILPNSIHPAIVNTALLAANAVLVEASLGFLGLSDPITVSWGRMINEGLPLFRTAWWTIFFAGVALSATIVAFTTVGDGLNEALNPRQRA